MTVVRRVFPSSVSSVSDVPPLSPDELADLIRSAVLEAVEPFARFSGPAFDAKTAADYLGISLRSLDGLVAGGEIRPVRPTPRSRRFLRETLDAFLRSRISR